MTKSTNYTLSKFVSVDGKVSYECFPARSLAEVRTYVNHLMKSGDWYAIGITTGDMQKKFTDLILRDKGECDNVKERQQQEQALYNRMFKERNEKIGTLVSIQ